MSHTQQAGRKVGTQSIIIGTPDPEVISIHNNMGVVPLNKFTTNPHSEYLYSQYSVVRRDVANNLVYLEAKQTGREFVMKEVTTNDDKAQFQIELLINQKKSRNNPLLKLEDVVIEDTQEYCHNRFKAYLVFEHPSKDLKMQILERRMKGQPYSEPEMMNILLTIILSLKFLKKIDQSHEAICSKNIYVMPNKEYKLIDPWLKTSNLEDIPSFHIYLSPQRTEAQSATVNDSFDWYLSDLYSLGILGLEMYYLEFMDGLYQNRKINQQLLQQRLDDINPRHGKFKQAIKGLVGPQRLRYQMVSDICSEYSRKIHVSPSPPKMGQVGSSESPRNIQFNLQSPRYRSVRTGNTGYRQLNRPSPFKKMGPKLDIPTAVKGNNFVSICVQNMQTNPIDMQYGPESTIAKPSTNGIQRGCIGQTSRTILQERNFKHMAPSFQKGSLLQENQLKSEQSVCLSIIPTVKGGTPNIDENAWVQKQQDYNSSGNQNVKLLSSQNSFSQSRTSGGSSSSPSKSANFLMPPSPQKSTRYNSMALSNAAIPQVSEASDVSVSADDILNSLEAQFQTPESAQSPGTGGRVNSRVTYINGTLYQGNLSTGFKNGYGKLYSQNGTVVFDGEWRQDKYQGFGRLINIHMCPLPQTFSMQNLSSIYNGWEQYEGQFVAGNKSGFGRLKLSNGDVYEGDFLNDRAHGKGIYCTSKGTKTVGQWNNGNLIAFTFRQK